MADIDPITREALRRATQMQGRSVRSPAPEPPKEHGAHHHKPPEHHVERPPEPPPKPQGINGGLEALFKDKETSVILILIILLMGEKGCEHLLLALIYLLI
ncbi:MAG: hypothetical protein K6F88_00070 [Ruminococcus sp.]|nr:hypothetical protein [Ruminococcus sp.]